MEELSVYFKKFKIATTILVITLIILIFMITRLVPTIQKIVEIQNEHKSRTVVLNDNERKLMDLKLASQKHEEEENNFLKIFFKPIEPSLDTESAMSDEFGEILQLMRENKVKARSIKYEYDPQDDNFVKNAGQRYSACRLDMEMVANYQQFENFLKDLYKHEHFLEISKVEVVPYQKNKKILLINAQIKLYSQKDPSQVQEEPAAQTTPDATEQPPADGAAAPNNGTMPAQDGAAPSPTSGAPEAPAADEF